MTENFSSDGDCSGGPGSTSTPSPADHPAETMSALASGSADVPSGTGQSLVDASRFGPKGSQKMVEDEIQLNKDDLTRGELVEILRLAERGTRHGLTTFVVWKDGSTDSLDADFAAYFEQFHRMEMLTYVKAFGSFEDKSMVSVDIGSDGAKQTVSSRSEMNNSIAQQRIYEVRTIASTFPGRPYKDLRINGRASILMIGIVAFITATLILLLQLGANTWVVLIVALVLNGGHLLLARKFNLWKRDQYFIMNRGEKSPANEPRENLMLVFTIIAGAAAIVQVTLALLAK